MKRHSEAAIALTIVNVSSKLQRRMNGALSVHGLGVSEFLVLKQLAEASHQCMRRVDLADSIGLTASGVTRLLNPMEKIGLVEKDASARDARVSLVRITSTGQQLLKDAQTAVSSGARDLLSKLEEEQKAKLLALLNKL